jgi:malonyl-ACP decarboxylase
MTQSLDVTGMGVVVATASGVTDFEQALRAGRERFGYLSRSGRTGPTAFPGAEIEGSSFASTLPGKASLLRTASFSAQAAVETVAQAWSDAGLDTGRIAAQRIGVVIGGTNFQARQQQQIIERYTPAPQLVRPTYALSLWDTDVIGLLMECFGFHGESYCVGGASAGGAMAIIHAARQLHAGLVDACIAVGPLFDISYWECQAFANLGAMGGAAFGDQPSLACRPFDGRHDGFIYGEGCAAIVLERGGHRRRSHGRLLGWGQAHDGTRGPEPKSAGQQRAIGNALGMAGLAPAEIDYVNTHGTGSPLGDATEVETIQGAGLSHCWINATKSLTGHCLTASGAIEMVAALIQLREGFLHPNRNLEQPIERSLRWVPGAAIEADLRYAVSNSFAFGGLSTALVLGR